MYFQQTKDHLVIRDNENVYAETYENAEADGMTIPELDNKYDYRIYEKSKDGSHKRHALVADHGEICDDGGENWQPGEDAFSDLAELCKRKERRLKKAQEDAHKALEEASKQAQDRHVEEETARIEELLSRTSS